MSQPPRNGTPSGNTPEGQEWYVLPPDRPSDADPSAGTSGAFGMPAQPPGGGAPAHGPYPQGGPADLPYGPHPGGHRGDLGYHFPVQPHGPRPGEGPHSAPASPPPAAQPGPSLAAQPGEGGFPAPSPSHGQRPGEGGYPTPAPSHGQQPGEGGYSTPAPSSGTQPADIAYGAAPPPQGSHPGGEPQPGDITYGAALPPQPGDPAYEPAPPVPGAQPGEGAHGTPPPPDITYSAALPPQGGRPGGEPRPDDVTYGAPLPAQGPQPGGEPQPGDITYSGPLPSQGSPDITYSGRLPAQEPRPASSRVRPPQDKRVWPPEDDEDRSTQPFPALRGTRTLPPQPPQQAEGPGRPEPPATAESGAAAQEGAAPGTGKGTSRARRTILLGGAAVLSVALAVGVPGWFHYSVYRYGRPADHVHIVPKGESMVWQHVEWRATLFEIPPPDSSPGSTDRKWLKAVITRTALDQEGAIRHGTPEVMLTDRAGRTWRMEELSNETPPSTEQNRIGVTYRMEFIGVAPPEVADEVELLVRPSTYRDVPGQSTEDFMKAAAKSQERNDHVLRFRR